jgi:hypothetical protein
MCQFRASLKPNEVWEERSEENDEDEAMELDKMAYKFDER